MTRKGWFLPVLVIAAAGLAALTLAEPVIARAADATFDDAPQGIDETKMPIGRFQIAPVEAKDASAAVCRLDTRTGEISFCYLDPKGKVVGVTCGPTSAPGPLPPELLRHDH